MKVKVMRSGVYNCGLFQNGVDCPYLLLKPEFYGFLFVSELGL